MQNISEKLTRKGKLGWLTAYIAGISLSLYVGFCFPHTFSANQYHISIWDGVYRRALFGTVMMGVWHVTGYSYWSVAVVGFLVAAAVLWVVVRYALRCNDVVTRALVALLLFAPTGALFVHLSGYLDHLVFLGLFVSVWAWRRGHTAVAVATVTALIFVHEISILLALPIFALVVVASRPHLRRLLLLAIPALVGALVLLSPPASPSTIQQIFDRLDSRIDFPINPGAINLYERTLSENWDVYEIIGGKSLGEGILLALPYFVVITFFWVAMLVWQRKVSLFEKTVTAVAWASSVAPLFLTFGGADFGRWILLSLCAFVMSLVIWLERLPERPPVGMLLLAALPFVLMFYAPVEAYPISPPLRPLDPNYIIDMPPLDEVFFFSEKPA